MQISPFAQSKTQRVCVVHCALCVRSEDELHQSGTKPCRHDHPGSICGSEFSESNKSESEDELERHLPLLLPEELADLGIDALQVGQKQAAMKYLLLAQLRWSETVGRRLAAGDNIQVSDEHIQDRSLCIHLLHQSIFRARCTLQMLLHALAQNPLFLPNLTERL